MWQTSTLPQNYADTPAGCPIGFYTPALSHYTRTHIIHFERWVPIEVSNTKILQTRQLFFFSSKSHLPKATSFLLLNSDHGCSWKYSTTVSIRKCLSEGKAQNIWGEAWERGLFLECQIMWNYCRALFIYLFSFRIVWRCASCMIGHTCICTCMGKPEVQVKCLPPLLYTLFVRQGLSQNRKLANSGSIINYLAPGILCLHPVSIEITGGPQ